MSTVENKTIKVNNSRNLLQTIYKEGNENNFILNVYIIFGVCLILNKPKICLFCAQKYNKCILKDFSLGSVVYCSQNYKVNIDEVLVDI